MHKAGHPQKLPERWRYFSRSDAKQGKTGLTSFTFNKVPLTRAQADDSSLERFHFGQQLAVLLLLHLCYSLLRRCVALSSIVHTLGLVLLLARFCLLSQLPLSASVPVRTQGNAMLLSALCEHKLPCGHDGAPWALQACACVSTHTRNLA